MAEDTSTRTIASVGAVLGVAALLIVVVQSAQTGLIAQFAGTTNQVSQENEAALNQHISALAARVEKLEGEVAALKKAPATPPPAPQ